MRLTQLEPQNWIYFRSFYFVVDMLLILITTADDLYTYVRGDAHTQCKNKNKQKRSCRDIHTQKRYRIGEGERECQCFFSGPSSNIYL